MNAAPLTIHTQPVVIPDGGQTHVPELCDYVRFDVLPAGVLVGLNGGALAALATGHLIQGEPGAKQIHTFRLVNTTNAPVTAQVTTGTGSLSVATGTSGASTEAKQDTGNTHLGNLAAATQELPGLTNIGSGANQNFANCRSVAVLNTGATGNVTITINGAATTLAPGHSVAWQVTKPLATLTTINVAAPAGGSANVAFTQ